MHICALITNSMCVCWFPCTLLLSITVFISKYCVQIVWCIDDVLT